MHCLAAIIGASVLLSLLPFVGALAVLSQFKSIVRGFSRKENNINESTRGEQGNSLLKGCGLAIVPRRWH
eukprot:scaffold85164_cov34-Prasinocladus_malaysianus.AAC.1